MFDEEIEELRTQPIDEYVKEECQKTIAQIIHRRRRAPMTRRVLAERIGSTYERLSDIENGIADPKFSELELIATELDCTMADLMPPYSRSAKAFVRGLEAVSEPIRAAIHDLMVRLHEASKQDRGEGT